MPKIEVQFEANFESNAVLPIHIGRLMIGSHIMRLNFYPDGKVRGVISEEAAKDGSLILATSPDLSNPLGFSREKRK